MKRSAGSMNRRTWPLVLVTVIACSVFAANAIAALVEASYLGPAPHGARALPPPPKAAPSRVRPDDHVLVARNIFCSTCAPGPSPTDSFDPQAVLIATIQGAEPRATLRVLASEAQGSWGIGEIVPGVGTIDRIGWVSVDVVDDRGRRATLHLLSSSAPAEKSQVAAAPDDPWTQRVKKLDDHTFEVDRALVRELANGATKPGSMRMMPVSENGVLTGIRVFGAQSGSLASALGLKNGDVLTAVNNQPIKSAQALIDMYAQLDSLNYVELSGTRGGKPMTLDLRLR